MNKVYIGWDNGVGTISILWPDGTADYSLTPIRKCLSYTKKKNYVSRIDVIKVKELINKWLEKYPDHSIVNVGIERPFTSNNPLYKKGVVIGARMHEAQLIIIEDLGLAYEFVDSDGWQKLFLPKGVEGSTELKAASLDIGKRKWPHLANKMKKDADSLFIALYLRHKELNPKSL